MYKRQVDYLKTDLGFSKLLYKYLLMNDQISGQDLCLVLYEQGVLSKEDEAYSRLASGELNSYDFMINKIANLEIEPAQLALKPCSASAVVTDVNTGKVVACVSYPGYDNNRPVSYTHLLVTPREIYMEAVRCHAVSLILVHNHPGGDPEPSGCDREITQRIYEAGELLGIRLLDHIIIGDRSYTSFKERGMMR